MMVRKNILSIFPIFNKSFIIFYFYETNSIYQKYVKMLYDKKKIKYSITYRLKFIFGDILLKQQLRI